MDTTSFIISTSSVSALYILTFVGLLIRAKHSYILKRTPMLLYFSMLGGAMQNIIILSIIAYTSRYITIHHQSTYKTILKLRQSGSLLAHILLIFPYLLRGYRLHFIFHLDKNWEKEDDFFRKNIHRTSQIWLFKVLAISLALWAIAVIIIFSTENGNYLPGCEIKSSTLQLNISQCLYILVCFFEQLSLVICLFSLRDVFDDYNMTRELVWVTIFCLLTPASPFFTDDGTYFLIPILLRNVFLLVRSMIVPIILSFNKQHSLEVITQEMIHSFELVLQTEIGLHYFEKFLKASNKVENKFQITGVEALDLYMKCEKYLIFPSEIEKILILEELKNFGISHCEIQADSFICQMKNELFGLLKSEYFPKFLKSKQYFRLKRQVMNQEIFIGRILQTSLQGNL